MEAAFSIKLPAHWKEDSTIGVTLFGTTHIAVPRNACKAPQPVAARRGQTRAAEQFAQLPGRDKLDTTRSTGLLERFGTTAGHAAPICRAGCAKKSVKVSNPSDWGCKCANMVAMNLNREGQPMKRIAPSLHPLRHHSFFHTARGLILGRHMQTASSWFLPTGAASSWSSGRASISSLTPAQAWHEI